MHIKKSKINVIKTLALSSILLMGIATNTYAYEDWGLISSDAESGSSNLTTDKDIEEGATEGITLGGTKLSTTNNTSLNVFDSKLSILHNLKASQGNITLQGGLADGAGSHTVTNNSIHISDNTLTIDSSGNMNFRGGLADGVGSHIVTNNSIHISDNILTASNNGNMNFNGGKASGEGNHKVTGNSIHIANSKLHSATYIWLKGGYANGEGNHDVSNNSFYIADSHIEAVTGIGLFSGTTIAKGTHNIKNNTFTLSGIVNITGGHNVYLAGGIIGEGKGDGDDRTGNTLILDKATVRLSSTGESSKINNFEHYKFIPTYKNIISNTPMLIADTIELGPDANISFGKIYGDGSAIQKDTEFTLLQANTALTGKFANIGNTHKLNQGIALTYDVTTKNTGDGTNAGDIIATISGVKTQEQAKVPAEAQVAMVAFVNQGADLINGAGLKNAKYATSNSYSSNWAAFGAMSGGDSRYDTGSHVDVKGYSVLTGFAKSGYNNFVGDVLYGGFIEYGRTNIKTHNGFDNQDDVKTSGDSKYYGAGVFTRVENYSNFYGEASLRLGHAEVDQNSIDYATLGGQNIGYDTSGMYYGAQLGLGQLVKVNEKSNVDLYAKYFWTHIEGDKATVAGDQFKFDYINSHRTRLGARYSYDISPTYSPYFGAAWEHEFDGAAKYSVYNLSAGTPTLKGDTGIFEAGVTFKNVKNKDIYINVGMEGYTGVREGYSGNIELVMEF